MLSRKDGQVYKLDKHVNQFFERIIAFVSLMHHQSIKSFEIEPKSPLNINGDASTQKVHGAKGIIDCIFKNNSYLNEQALKTRLNSSECTWIFSAHEIYYRVDIPTYFVDYSSSF